MIKKIIKILSYNLLSNLPYLKQKVYPHIYFINKKKVNITERGYIKEKFYQSWFIIHKFLSYNHNIYQGFLPINFQSIKLEIKVINPSKNVCLNLTIIEKENNVSKIIYQNNLNIQQYFFQGFLQIENLNIYFRKECNYEIKFRLSNSRWTDLLFIGGSISSRRNLNIESNSYQNYASIFRRQHAFIIAKGYYRKRCLILFSNLSDDLNKLIQFLKDLNFDLKKVNTRDDIKKFGWHRYSLIIYFNLKIDENLSKIIKNAVHQRQMQLYFHDDNSLSMKDLNFIKKHTELFYQYNNQKFLSVSNLDSIYSNLINKMKIKTPKVSIISILYKKKDTIKLFLDAIKRQSYLGEIEVILVDDCSPDESYEIAKNWYNFNKSSKNLTVNLIKNEENLGNCLSRNKGIDASNSEIIIIIDADCLMNKDFVHYHVDTHVYKNADIVIGPFNIETNKADPFTVLKKIELIGAVNFTPDLQDKINKDSFLNCITRNISYKSDLLKKEMFDPLFSYSKNIDSGYGWEDVELGYRMYLNNANIVYSNDTFTIHITHPESSIGLAKRSLKNFKNLINKHPELKYVARRWVIETNDKILNWIKESDGEELENNIFMNENINNFLPSKILLKNKKIKIITHRWHVPHQYELYKLGFEFYLIKNLPGLEDGFTKYWGYEQRPMPENAKFIDWKDVKESDYDLALLHFDENIIFQENSNGFHDENWGATCRFLLENSNLPKIGICHGTPQFYGQYNPKYDKSNLMSEIEDAKLKLKFMFSNIKVVLNSYQAQEEWSFLNSEVIWHGFDPTEFQNSDYSKGILTLGQNMHRPWYNGYFIQKKVNDTLQPDIQLETLKVPDPDFAFPEDGNNYAYGKFKNYINTLRRYSIYFNPTLRSPMPRSRGEAMMCGLVSVSMNNHDVSLFIDNEKNGFYSNNPEELASYIKFLINNPVELRKIGAESRKLALDKFNHDRYLTKWKNIIHDYIQ